MYTRGVGCVPKLSGSKLDECIVENFIISRMEASRRITLVFTQEVVQVTSKIVKITDNRIVIFVLFYNLDHRIFTQKWSTGRKL
jgi:hypothetical protein